MNLNKLKKLILFVDVLVAIFVLTVMLTTKSFTQAFWATAPEKSLTGVETMGFNFVVNPKETKTKAGETVTITLSVADINAGENGINSIVGSLNYDESVFETVEFQGLNSGNESNGNAGSSSSNRWNIEVNRIQGHELYGKFCIYTLQEGVKEDQDVVKITMKLKSDLVPQTTVVDFTGLVSSDGESEITEEDRQAVIIIEKTTEDSDGDQGGEQGGDQGEEQGGDQDADKDEEQNGNQSGNQNNNQNSTQDGSHSNSPQTGDSKIIMVIIIAILTIIANLLLFCKKTKTKALSILTVIAIGTFSFGIISYAYDLGVEEKIISMSFQERLLNSNKVLVRDNTISAGTPEMTVEEFLTFFDADIKLTKDGTEVTTGKLQTGMNVNLLNATYANLDRNTTYEVSVSGDINKDGKSNQVELTNIIRNTINNQKWQFSELEALSADMNFDGKIDNNDVQASVRYIVYGTYNIYEQTVAEDIRNVQQPKIEVVAGKFNEKLNSYTSEVTIRITETDKNATKTKYKIEEEIDEQNTGLEKYVEIEREYTDENGNVIKEFTIQNSGPHKISAFTYGALGNRSLINSIIVVKSDITLLVQPQDITMEYGTTQSITASTKNTGDIIWTSSDESVATVSETGVVIAKKLGTATITATASVDNTVSATCEVTVTPKTLEISASADDKVYDGTTNVVNGQILPNGIINGEDVSITADFAYEDANVGTDKKVNVTNIILSGADANNYKINETTLQTTASILAKNADNQDIQASLESTQVTYNGKEQKPTVTITDNGTSLVEGTDYDVQYTDNKNAGTATVTVTLKGNYLGTKILNFVIEKATLTATYVSETIEYGETPKLEVKVDNFVNGETAETAENYVEPKVTAIQLTPGQYTLTPQDGSSRNYEFNYVSGLLVINAKLNVDISLSKTQFTYDGTAKEPAVTVKDGEKVLTLGTDFTVSYSDNINAGTGTVTIILMGNYAGTSTKTFIINKAEGTASVSIEGWTYGEVSKNPVPSSSTNGIDNVTYLYTGTTNDGTTYSSTVAPTKAGNYKITATFAETQNFNKVTSKADFTISKAQLTPIATANNKVYDGNTTATGTITLDGAVNNENPTVTAIFTFESATAGTGKTVNATNIKLDSEWTANYELTTDTTTTTADIEAKDLTANEMAISLSQTDFTYDGTAKEPTVTIKDGTNTLVQGTDYTVIYTDNVNAGTATITITGTGNYSIQTTKTFTINKVKLTPSVTANNKVYDGDTTATGTITLDRAVNNENPTVTVSTVFTFNNATAGQNKTVIVSNIELEETWKTNYELTTDTATTTADITKATLTATYISEEINYTDTPKLDVTVTGFVNSETAETADGYTAPTLKNTNTEPGEYKLIPSGGTATNYSFEYVEGTLKIDLPIFTISYELNDGELENGKTNPDNYTQKSEDITLNNPTKSGYEFIGWSLTKLNGVAQDASTPSTSVTIAKGSKGNREYTANWNLVAPTVSVTVENSEVNLFDDVATTFTANVENAVNPTYQWYYNDTKITGATSSIYSISTTEMTESNYIGGNYSVAVTNNEAPSSSALGETNENTTTTISEPQTQTVAITVGTANQLKNLATRVNAQNITFTNNTVKQISNIDLSSVCGETLGNWTPIGYYSETSSKSIKGIYDGQNFEITNLYINETYSESRAGLFALLWQGTIKDLTVRGTITTSDSKAKTGGIIGQITNGNIDNCKNYVNVSGVNNVGGIVGFANSNGLNTITNCINYGTISNTGTYVGGIAGNSGVTIKNCINNGEITGYGIGGITGLTNTTSYIENCTNNANLTGNYIGGIVANNSSKIYNCVNKGLINVSSGVDKISLYAGGIVAINCGTIEQCYNTNNVKGVGEANNSSVVTGGIISVGGSNSVIKKCYNLGNISTECKSTITPTEDSGAAATAGGIIGYLNAAASNSIIENCYNTGAVDSKKTIGINTNNAGGIVGLINYNGITLSNCYNIGTITGSREDGKVSRVGGIVGYNVSDSLSDDEVLTVISNTYYLDSSTTVGIHGGDVTGSVESRTSNYMKTDDFVTLLGGENWKIVTGENDGYPILKWQY